MLVKICKLSVTSGVSSEELMYNMVTLVNDTHILYNLMLLR